MKTLICPRYLCPILLVQLPVSCDVIECKRLKPQPPGACASTEEAKNAFLTTSAYIIPKYIFGLQIYESGKVVFNLEDTYKQSWYL